MNAVRTPAPSRATKRVISIELYFSQIGGFRHSDTVLVTKDGFERLIKYTDDLDALIVHGSRLVKMEGVAYP